VGGCNYDASTHASIFGPQNGIPSCFLFRGRVRNGIPRFSVPRNSRNSIGNNPLFRLFHLSWNYFLSEIPNPTWSWPVGSSTTTRRRSPSSPMVRQRTQSTPLHTHIPRLHFISLRRSPPSRGRAPLWSALGTPDATRNQPNLLQLAQQAWQSAVGLQQRQQLKPVESLQVRLIEPAREIRQVRLVQ
jgi:hypothetical protein